jgi:hypothetical protein
MTERIVAPRLADIIEAIERIRRVLDGVTLEAFEQNWEKRWLVGRGIAASKLRFGTRLRQSNSSPTTAAVWGCDFVRQGGDDRGNELIYPSNSQGAAVKNCQANVAPHDRRARFGSLFAGADRARCRVSSE